MQNKTYALTHSKANLIVAFALAISMVSSGSLMGVEMLQVARRLCRQLLVVSDLAQQSTFVVCVERSQPAMGNGRVGLG